MNPQSFEDVVKLDDDTIDTNFVPLEIDFPGFDFANFELEALQDANANQDIVPLDNSPDLVPIIARKHKFEFF